MERRAVLVARLQPGLAVRFSSWLDRVALQRNFTK